QKPVYDQSASAGGKPRTYLLGSYVGFRGLRIIPLHEAMCEKCPPATWKRLSCPVPVLNRVDAMTRFSSQRSNLDMPGSDWSQSHPAFDVVHYVKRSADNRIVLAQHIWPRHWKAGCVQRMCAEGNNFPGGFRRRTKRLPSAAVTQ